MEEENEIENDWKDELKQVAEDMGFEEQDYCSDNDDTSSLEEWTDDSISSYRYSSKKDSDGSSSLKSKSLSSRDEDDDLKTLSIDKSRFLNVELDPNPSDNATSPCYKITRVDRTRKEDEQDVEDILQRVSGEEYSLGKTCEDGDGGGEEETGDNNDVDTVGSAEEQKQKENGAPGKFKI